MPTRIDGLTTATAIEADDYLVIDGQTEGTRKMLVSDVGGEKMYDFETSLTPTIDARGVTGAAYRIEPAESITGIELIDLLKIKVYLITSTGLSYPLILTSVVNYSNAYVSIECKSIEYNVQGTSSSTISGTLHVIAPFEISSVSTTM